MASDTENKKTDLYLSFEEIAVTSDTKSSYNCCLWDMENARILEQLYDGNSGLNCVTTVGSDYVMSSIKGTNVLKVWPAIGNLANALDIVCPYNVTAIDVSYNGTYCVGAMDCRLYLWQVFTGKLIAILSMHLDEIRKVKFTIDENYIISSAMDSMLMAWKISDVFDTENSSNLKPSHIWRLGCHGVSDFAVPCYGSENKVVVITNSKCKVFSIETGDCLITFEAKNDSLFTAVTTDIFGNIIFIGKADGRVLQLEPNFTPNPEKSHKDNDLPMKTLHLHKSLITCLSRSMDGSLLISGSTDRTAVVWNIFTSQVLHVLQHEGTVWNAIFMPCTSTYPSRKVVKPFQFHVSKFDISAWKCETKPIIDDSKIIWDEKTYGNKGMVESTAEQLQDSKPKLSEKQLLQIELTNEIMFAYGNFINS